MKSISLLIAVTLVSITYSTEYEILIDETIGTDSSGNLLRRESLKITNNTNQIIKSLESIKKRKNVIRELLPEGYIYEIRLIKKNDTLFYAVGKDVVFHDKKTYYNTNEFWCLINSYEEMIRSQPVLEYQNININEFLPH